eukprot:1353828-Rhodomonas_salina.1
MLTVPSTTGVSSGTNTIAHNHSTLCVFAYQNTNTPTTNTTSASRPSRKAVRFRLQYSAFRN